MEGRGARKRCEAALALDIRVWHRRDLLLPGRRITCSWQWGDKCCGTIDARIEFGAAVLIFRRRAEGGLAWECVEQAVPITWTRCHLGGSRPWFHCPARHVDQVCGRRVALLYLAGGMFACRRCHRLAYASQQQSHWGRLLHRAQKIRLQLGGSASLCEPFPGKPKRMHWSRYLTLRRRGLQSERSVMTLMEAWLSRLQRSVERQRCTPGRRVLPPSAGLRSTRPGASAHRRRPESARPAAGSSTPK
jgi:hypothetical protein